MHPATAALQAEDQRAAEGAAHPRVSLQSMQAKMRNVRFMRPGMHINAFEATDLDPITLCFVTMDNGFVVVGKSAPASMANFDAEKGREFAYKDAVDQLWAFEGYLLRENIVAQEFATEVMTAAGVGVASNPFANIEADLRKGDPS